MSGQHRAGEVVEASRACLAPIPLPVSLGLIKAVPDHGTAATCGAVDTLRPAMLAYQGEALASSISAKRLTRSGAAILKGPHARWPARAALADYHRGPTGTLPRPSPITPEPNKSLKIYASLAAPSIHRAGTGCRRPGGRCRQINRLCGQ